MNEPSFGSQPPCATSADWSLEVTISFKSWTEGMFAGRRSPPPPEIPRGAHQRLVDCLHDDHAGELDRVVAVRGWLRAEGLRWSSNQPVVEIEWPGAKPEILVRCGFVQRVGRWRVAPWRPSWLPHIPPAGVDTAWWPARRRPEEYVLGDPFLGLLALDQYTSSAQREAVRLALCAPVGACIAICLPTGAGKSLCAFLPAVLPFDRESELRGVTIIVVPTVALQLDLASRLAGVVGHEIALRPEDSESKANILARCRVGSQGPLLVSPEALGGELLGALSVAARAGYVRQFVVDEAHMVLSWGDEFRPAFLQLPNVRRELLTAAQENGHPAFTTLLLSATFTDYHLRWLRSFFGPSDKFHVSHAARLRPEPAYWVALAADSASRDQWVLEAIHHLPRPCILYTTTKPACERWAGLLRAAGYRRLATMTGETPETQRREVLRRWKRNDVDIVIATSAFGLGVDKADVRTILHAELPETIDRFYQDVGRSGRDGHEACSLLVTTPADFKIAANLGQPRFIRPENGWQRWMRMYSARVSTSEPDVYLIPLDVGRELDMLGDHNRGWNLRTLQLLVRAGALEFVSHRDQNWDKVAVRFGLAPIREITYWEGPVEELRQELLRDNRAQQELLGELTTVRQSCHADLFEACYSSATFDLSVVRACGGCPACRAASLPKVCGRILPRRRPEAPPPAHPSRPPHRRALDSQKWLGESKVGLVILPEESLPSEDLEDFFLWAMQADWAQFILPDSLQSVVRATAVRWQERAFVNVRPPYRGDVLYLQPAVWWLADPVPAWWPTAMRIGEEQSQPARLIVARSDVPHFEAENRKLADLFAGPRLSWHEWKDRFLG